MSQLQSWSLVRETPLPRGRDHQLAVFSRERRDGTRVTIASNPRPNRNSVSTMDLDARCESRGTERPPDEFLSAVYGELRRLANLLLRRTARTPSLPATALVHEAYMRLCESPTFHCQDEQHYLSVAARAMRQILLDRQRSRRRLRRGGTRCQVSLDRGLDVAERDHLDLIALDDSL